MKTLKFHGSLEALCPEGFTCEAQNVAELFSALRLHPSFNPKSGKRYTVSVEGFDTKASLHNPTDEQVIHVHPAMVGAGGKGVMQTIVGAVLIVVGVVIDYVTMGTGGNAFIAAGIGMMAGGIIAMLMPSPSVTGQSDEKSRYLSGAKNTVAIGTRIPLVFGRRKVYGHYISFNTDATDLSHSPGSWYASSFGDYSSTNRGNVPALP